jgi:hypothetical protein
MNECSCGHDCHCNGECKDCVNDICYNCDCQENQKDIPESFTKETS